jgi:outer membrane receptor for ferrienterochelin and colicins
MLVSSGLPGIRIDNHRSAEEYTADKKVFESDIFPKTGFEQTSYNPRIALKFDMNEHLSLRANFGTGYRAPYGFSEDLHLCSGSPRVWKSSDLEPETSLSYNFSLDYYGEKMTFSTNLFRTNLNNKIGFTDAEDAVAALGYDYQWKNIDDAFVQGIELSIFTSISKHFETSVDFACNQGKYKNIREDWTTTEYENISKYISRFPQTTGNINLNYNPKTWNFTITGNYQGTMYIDYFSEVDEQSKIKKTDPFMLFNARMSKKIKGIKLYAGINNLLNYIQPEKHMDDAAFMYAPVYGTMFYGGISIHVVH